MSDIAGLLRTYERHDLDLATAPNFDPVSLDGLSFIRARGISAYWRKPPNEQGAGSALDVVIGAHALRGWFAFVVRGSGEALDIQVAAGAPAEVTRLMSAAYPGIQIQPGSNVLGSALVPLLLHSGHMTGIPSATAVEDRALERPRATALSRIARGMKGATWALVVRGWPSSIESLLEHREALVQQISALAPRARQTVQRTIQENYSPTDHSSRAVSDVLGGEVVNRDVEYLLQVLERSLERLDETIAIGGWEVEVTYGSSDVASAQQLAGLLRGAFAGAESRPDRIRTLAATAGARSRGSGPDLHTLLSSRELALLVDLPRDEAQGFQVTDFAAFDIDPPPVAAPVVSIGEILRDSSRSSVQLSLSARDLSKHALVVGVTGSGKTTTVSSLLRQVRDLGVPFLVAEPAKTEYRTLLARSGGSGTPLVPDLRIYTVGNDRVAPFRLNPFEFDMLGFPDVSLLLTHIDTLKAVFNAAFVLYAPMPYVLEMALHEIYEDRGWDLATGLNLRLPPDQWQRRSKLPIFPTLVDLRQKVADVTRRLGYDVRVERDVTAGLQGRIDSLRVGAKGLMLDTPRGIPMDELLASPTVLELESIGHDNEKAFVMGLVFARLCEFRRLQAATGRLPSSLQHVLVIEEAHRLLRNTDTEVDVESSNLRAQAVESLVNMLSEVRKYGQMVVLAEQVPRKLAPDAIKNTNLKIFHRIVAGDDREVLAGSANMTPEQSRRLATLGSGEAVVYAEGADHPYLVVAPDVLAGRREHAPIDTQLAVQAKGYVRLQDSLLVPDIALFGVPAVHFGAPDPTQLQAVLAFASGKGYGAAWAKIVLRTVHARDKVPAALESLQRAFTNFSSHLPIGTIHRSIRLAVVVGAAHAIQARATEYAWSFSSAEQMRLSLTRGLLLTLQSGQTPDAAPLDGFARAYEAATRRQVGPFPGCIHCPNPCFHRADVGLLITPTLQRGLIQTLEGANKKAALTQYRAAANLVREATTHWLDLEVCSPQSIAYCAALTCAARAGLDEYQQDDVARQISPHLLARDFATG